MKFCNFQVFLIYFLQLSILFLFWYFDLVFGLVELYTFLLAILILNFDLCVFF